MSRKLKTKHYLAPIKSAGRWFTAVFAANSPPIGRRFCRPPVFLPLIPRRYDSAFSGGAASTAAKGTAVWPLIHGNKEVRLSAVRFPADFPPFSRQSYHF
jgi:hypothetical protein